MAAEALRKELVPTHSFHCLLEAGRAEGGNVLRGGALIGVFDQAPLKDIWVRRVDDDQALETRVIAERGGPADRSAPVVADEGEVVETEPIDQREQVADEFVGRITLGVLRRVRTGKAALIGHDQAIFVLEERHEPTPGAV